MSLAVALPCAVMSAVAYGTATAVQHRAAHRDTGRADARGVLPLARDPRWLASVGGDTVGLVLQVAALATGPVLLVQPLLVLAVPVALPVGRMLGGPAPTSRDYAACVGILGSLAVFFVLVGNPGQASPLPAANAAWATVAAAAVGAVLLLAVRAGSPTARAVVYGAVAGAWFGLGGVLLDAVATTWQRSGRAVLTQPDGWVPLLCLLLVGTAALVLTQVSFQVGSLAASFPANEATAPVVAVVLGAALLHERLPLSPGHVTAYLLCVAVVAAGTVQLARGLSSG
ncbi:MAG TPA: DMT family transporter [Actinomycetales bacterium]|nr:DMT family transporter [Actinomycetales bacterium]